MATMTKTNKSHAITLITVRLHTEDHVRLKREALTRGMTLNALCLAKLKGEELPPILERYAESQ